MLSAEVTLRPMSEDEYAGWRADAVEGYAAEIAASTGHDVADLRAQATSSSRSICRTASRPPATGC